MATFEQRLTELRKEKKISQEDLGAVIGVTRWSILNYEAGKNRPDYEGLMALANYFKVSLDYLTGRTDQR